MFMEVCALAVISGSEWEQSALNVLPETHLGKAQTGGLLTQTFTGFVYFQIQTYEEKQP